MVMRESKRVARTREDLTTFEEEDRGLSATEWLVSIAVLVALFALARWLE